MYLGERIKVTYHTKDHFSSNTITYFGIGTVRSIQTAKTPNIWPKTAGMFYIRMTKFYSGNIQLWTSNMNMSHGLHLDQSS